MHDGYLSGALGLLTVGQGVAGCRECQIVLRCKIPLWIPLDPFEFFSWLGAFLNPLSKYEPLNALQKGQHSFPIHREC